MSKLQVNDLNPVSSNDSFALKDQIKNLTEYQSKNIVGGHVIIINIG